MLKWYRRGNGVYEAKSESGIYRIEKVDARDMDHRFNNSNQWNCYLNGKVFDAGSTLQEAKSYCENGK